MCEEQTLGSVEPASLHTRAYLRARAKASPMPPAEALRGLAG